MGGALLVSLFWQQCGWLAHDFAHHQVFKDRRWNDAAVLFIGNFLQAFSLDWWKNKHNTHHAIPNTLETRTDEHDGDPDIDTLPFLAWNQRFVDKIKAGGPAASPWAQFFVRNQMVLYFPVLFFARITWALSSIATAFSLNVSLFGSEAEIVKGVEAKLAAAKESGARARVAASPGAVAASAGALHYPFWERAMLLGHYAWYLALVFGCNPLPTALCYFFVSQTFAGLLLAVVFGVGHNGMPCYEAEARPGFAELQVTTTRNVHDAWGNGWFTGGLHYQVEHHLFTFVPRHNLPKLRPLIVDMCKRHGVRYHATGLFEGNAEVLSVLENVSKSLRDFPAM
jgi:fatty acid desaturase